MRLASFRSDGGVGYGLVEGDALRLASDDFVRRFPTLRSVLAGDAVQELGADVARHGTPRTLAGLA
ncbi:MAG: Rv2993c-like domain-containing protein, partial [Alphaproteobacteria bacterium]